MARSCRVCTFANFRGGDRSDRRAPDVRRTGSFSLDPGAQRSSADIQRVHRDIRSAVGNSGMRPKPPFRRTLCSRRLHYSSLLVYRLHVVCESSGYCRTRAYRYLLRYKAARCSCICRRATWGGSCRGLAVPVADTQVLTKAPPAANIPRPFLTLIYFVVAGAALKRHCFPAFTAKITSITDF